MRERLTYISHRVGIATPDASWDDAIQRTDVVLEDGWPVRVRMSQALVTTEFMRDAIEPLDTVARLLEAMSA